MSQSFSQVFEAVCQTHGDRIATIDPAGAPVSFSNLFYTVLAFAEALQDHGICKGDLVAVHVVDPIAGSALKLALLRIGATAMGRIGADGSLGFAPDWHLVTPGTPATGGRDIVVGRDWIRSPGRWVPMAGGGRMIRSTSGTTGFPKLRVFSDESFLARLRRGLDWRGRPEGPVFIGYGPASSPFFNHFARALMSGVMQVHPREDDVASLALMDSAGVTAAFLAPWNFRRMLATAEAGADRPKTLRRIVTGGGEVTPETAARAERVFGVEVILSYGSSETGSIAHARPSDRSDLPGYVGRVYGDFELRFQAEDGSAADPAEGGELWLKVPEDIRIRAYPSQEPITDADGWLGTGDICRMLPDGGLQFVGRRSELLNIGGVKCAPQRFEVMVRDRPGVADVAAFALPEPGGGDRLGLALVPGPGLDAEALASWLNEHLGANCPFDLFLRDAIPVTAAGKIDRRRLSEEYLDATPANPLPS